MEFTLLAMYKNGDLSKLDNQNNSIYTYNKLKFVTNKYTFDDINSGEIVKKLEIKENKLYIDEDLSTELKRAFAHIYPYSKAKAVALKTSVSTMLNEVDYVEQNDEPQELVVGENIISNIGIDIGNAYHAVMERIDYFKENDVVDIISSLVSQGIIEHRISRLVDVSKINKAVGVISAMITPNTRVLKEQQFMIRDKHSNLVETSKDDTKVMVQGIIDLVLIENGVATVIDFKTNKIESEEELINKYKLQIELYSKAIVGATSARADSKYLYSFYLNKLIKL
jgi:ATP-dependent helicase/nuclease subunit A